MLEFFDYAWHGRQTGLGRWWSWWREGGGGGGGRRGWDFWLSSRGRIGSCYLASPAKPALTKTAGLTVYWKLEILILFAYILH